MGVGFGERLTAAMVAADVLNAEDLARRCRMPETVVRGWIESGGESMSVREALTLRKVLHVRAEWLLDGAGTMVSIQGRPGITEALRVAEKLSPDKAAYWLRIGARMLGRLP